MPCTCCFRAKRTYRIVEEWEEKEEQASDALLDLHEKLARVQAEVAEAAGRLSRIRAIRKRVKERYVEIFTQGMQELEEDDILPALAAHKGSVIGDLQFQAYYLP
ncbi:hypothetical protein K456DRAFT_59688 [Colletotrichum gloeosporioides 23]|nr:hypothetical protein K456DRAFT_59688 [Colletotrichum gloeosporioides 23]